MKRATQRSRVKIPFKNRSPQGWWIGSYLLRFEWNDERKDRLNRRCKAWKNTVLIKAKHRDEAYKKIRAIGRAHNGMEFWDEGDRSRRGIMIFEGLTMLLPVYQKIEDGAEVLWSEYEPIAVKTVKKMVRSKDQLEAFDDSDRV
jgi:hypothetical protein